MTRPPLVVDLDGTLIRSDLLYETATRFIVSNPLGSVRLIPWAVAGPARLKSELASRVDLDVAALPFDMEVLAWVRDEATTGRQLALVSASHESLVQAVAEHVGVFDTTMGTTADSNLRAERKAAALVDRYGAGGFEYVGNHKHDIPVWKDSAVGHVVTRSGRLAAAAGPGGRRFTPEHSSLGAWIRALRPHQWLKNLLVLVPLVTAQLVFDRDALVAALTAFVVFCLVASSVYILNDLADLDNDRHHPRKQTRPFASGQLSLLHGWMMWPVLAVLGFGISVALLPWAFTAVLAGYLAITLAYTFALKRKHIADIITLAALYTIRVIAGIAAIEVAASMWLLTFSLFVFLSLALVKRVSELVRVREDGAEAKGRGYHPEDIEILSSFGVASSVAAAIIFALYVDDPVTTELYATPELLWGALPILLTWLMRTWLLAYRGNMHEDPILFAARDRWSLVAAGALAAVFLAAKLVSL